VGLLGESLLNLPVLQVVFFGHAAYFGLSFVLSFADYDFIFGLLHILALTEIVVLIHEFAAGLE